MKKLAVLLVFGNFYFGQNITFGDENFKKSLIQTYPSLDANKDGEISFEEAKTQTSIRNLSLYNYTKIKSISGIEAFVNLTELDVKQNEISSVALSQNTKIKTLNLRENQITGALDLSALADATTVELNSNKISSIELPLNGKIQFLYANDNLLTSINLSQQKDLKRPFLVRNQISSIDFSNNVNIDRINMDENPLTSVNLSGLSKLSWASFVSNQLTAITFHNNPVLKTLLLQNNNLSTLNFRDSLPNALTLINLSGNNSFVAKLKDCSDTISGLTPANISIENGCDLSVSGAKHSAIEVFPNPFTEKIQFTKQVTDVEVYDNSGRKVFAQKTAGTELNLSKLAKGSYVMKYSENGKLSTKILMKQ